MSSKVNSTGATALQTNYIQTERLKFHYRAQGYADAPPMLLLHGEFATSRWWEPFLEILPAEIRAIAPDLRGAGQTEHPEAGYTIADQCTDLSTLVDALGLTDFDLVAHSAASAIAIEYALQNQHKLASLTLVSGVPVDGIHTPIDTLMLLEQMKTDRALLSESLALLMPTLFVESPSKGEAPIKAEAIHDYANSEFFQQLVDDAAAMAPQLFTSFAESLNQWNRFAEATELTLPSLIIWGDQDTIVTQDGATRTLIAIPGAANLEILRGVGHSPMIEAPLRLAERIIDFVVGDHDSFSEIRDSVEEEGIERTTDS